MKFICKILLQPTIFLCTLVQIHAQALIYPASAPYQAAARYAPMVTDAFTHAVNPATLSGLSGFCAGVNVENRFLVPGFNRLTLSASYRKSPSGFSLRLRYFGDQEYNENTCGLNYGFSLGKITLGAIFNYHFIHFAGNPAESYLQYGLASLWRLSDKVYSSFRITNPGFFRARERKNYPLATTIQMGIGCLLSPNLYLGIELEKEEGKTPQVIFALCYQYASDFFFKGYWTAQNHQPFISAGWQWKNLRVETGCAFHPVLGISPSLTLLLQPKNVVQPE